MLKLSKGSEYAIIGLLYISTKGTGGVSVEEIAHEKGISRAFLAKLFHTLATRKLVRSYRGREGGFVLARASSEITLLEIIEAIEGPVDFDNCFEKKSMAITGEFSEANQLWKIFKECEGRVVGLLDSHTLSSLSRRTE